MEYLKVNSIDILLQEIDSLIEKFNLSKENAEGYKQLRDYYNNENNVFYTLVCYAFNYQIRFNLSGKYNMPFGKDRSSFNPTLRQKFIDFVEKLHNKNCRFTNLQFDTFDFSNLKKNNLVYCDPPYFNSTASYNENGGWTEHNEKDLLKVLDNLNERDIKFALSNNLKYENPLLCEWKNKYKVHYIHNDYSNCNYQKIDRSKDIEVLITNY